VSNVAYSQFAFRVREDGMVFMAGVGDDMRSVITDSSISFESRDGGIVEAVALRGTNARLSGTRTVTVPGVPLTSYRVTCTPGAQ
jgi:hypothetical protein